jgi:biopolymer transport protein ExbD
MRIPSPRAEKRARIEIIPLIDVIFFLLATFVMVSLSMNKNRGIPVNLPVASSGVSEQRKDHVAITITEGGGLYLDADPVPPEQLTARLLQLKSSNPDPRVFINGDTKSYFGQVIDVLDEVRRLGIGRVAIETKPARGSAEAR